MPNAPKPSQGPAHGPRSPRWDQMTPAAFGRPVRAVQTDLFPLLAPPPADGFGTLDLFAGSDVLTPAAAPEPCDNCDGDDATACGCCPACDTTKAERCATCTSCRCDTHDYCGPSVPVVVRAAALLLDPTHTAATINAYGACTAPGYSVNPGPDGRARIHHRFPNLNPTDPNRLPQDQRWTEARAQANAYAATLETAGWTVERKTVTTGAIVLAVPPETHPGRHRVKGGRHVHATRMVPVNMQGVQTPACGPKGKPMVPEPSTSPVTCPACRRALGVDQ
ncbi:hypothetical protein ACIA7S_28695 [Streptomyces sp. NPDC051643]|uniref:hypothetical protein n=1 Tax=Streptomyces sp. NPDC051643 TaxID=3365665 RepID=UPI0037B00A4B